MADAERYRIAIEAGALLRRDFRRLLMRRGIEHTEDRGFLDSQFILKGTRAELEPLLEIIRGFNEDEQ